MVLLHIREQSIYNKTGAIIMLSSHKIVTCCLSIWSLIFCNLWTLDSLEITNLLLKHGADPNLKFAARRKSSARTSPISFHVSEMLESPNNLELVQLLMDYGAKDEEEMTLFTAQSAGYFKKKNSSLSRFFFRYRTSFSNFPNILLKLRQTYIMTRVYDT